MWLVFFVCVDYVRLLVSCWSWVVLAVRSGWHLALLVVAVVAAAVAVVMLFWHFVGLLCLSGGLVCVCALINI